MKPTEGDTKDMFANPYYAVVIDERLFNKQGTTIAKEDWVLANTKFIDETGASAWLTDMLAALVKEPTDDLIQLSINPRQAVAFSKRLNNEHEPIIAVDVWISANVKLMGELGVEVWLWQLLDVLETGGSKAA